MRHLVLGGLLALGLAACGSDSGGMNTGDDTPPADASGNPDGNGGTTPPAGFTELLSRDWTLPAGQLDTYRCLRVTVPNDIYVTDIAALAPAGTHHTVLSIVSSNVAGPDGPYDCSVGEIGRPMLYASGVGTDPLTFPTNVGLKIAAGTQIHLNLHLFNATDNDIGGKSGIYVKTTPTAPPMLAEMVFAGRILFGFGPGEHDVVGGCTVQTGFHMFAYWPHMHKLATHSKLELMRGGDPAQDTVIHDDTFAFGEQKYYLDTPEIMVNQGDKIQVTCHYNNTTGGMITFGDSSNAEMCFIGMYRYPSQNASITQCTDRPQGI